GRPTGAPRRPRRARRLPCADPVERRPAPRLARRGAMAAVPAGGGCALGGGDGGRPFVDPSPVPPDAGAPPPLPRTAARLAHPARRTRWRAVLRARVRR